MSFARRGLAVLFVVLLVTTSAATPVAAQTVSGDCSPSGFLRDFIGFFIGVDDPHGTCEVHTTNTIEEMKEIDANQTEVDIYSGAVGSKAGHEAWVAPVDNYLNDSESVAWMKAQVAIAEAYQNGATKLEAQVAARQAIADYYAIKQRNVLEATSQHASEMAYLASVARNESGVSKRFLYAHGDHSDGSSYDGEFWITGRSNATYTLVNGNTTTYTTLTVKNHQLGFGTTGDEETWSLSNLEPHNNKKTTLKGALKVKAPNSNYDQQEVFDYEWYKTRLQVIQSKNSNLQDEAENFVNATWEDYDSGQINASDVISANTAMFEYGTQTGDESSLYSSTAALALMGFDTPDLNSSGLMNVTYQNTTYQGLVLARSAPGGAWQANTTYNASNISGPVFLATADGRKVDLTDEFTVTEMTAKDGTNIQTQNTTTYVYKTANTSQLLEMQEQLTELRMEIEEREQAVGGDGGSGSGLNTQLVGAAVIVGAVAVLLIQREGRQ
ncbi:hypothetical protein [Haloferax larsenii]|nr:hypothetical protein [Haloferax larsenii]